MPIPRPLQSPSSADSGYFLESLRQRRPTRPLIDVSPRRPNLTDEAEFRPIGRIVMVFSGRSAETPNRRPASADSSLCNHFWRRPKLTM